MACFKFHGGGGGGGGGGAREVGVEGSICTVLY